MVGAGTPLWTLIAQVRDPIGILVRVLSLGLFDAFCVTSSSWRWSRVEPSFWRFGGRFLEEGSFGPDCT